eukprot:m51a1_g9399 hypothetical protein (473) ;mRNA; r:290463-292366
MTEKRCERDGCKSARATVFCPDCGRHLCRRCSTVVHGVFAWHRPPSLWCRSCAALACAACAAEAHQCCALGGLADEAARSSAQLRAAQLAVSSARRSLSRAAQSARAESDRARRAAAAESRALDLRVGRAAGLLQRAREAAVAAVEGGAVAAASGAARVARLAREAEDVEAALARAAGSADPAAVVTACHAAVASAKAFVAAADARDVRVAVRTEGVDQSFAALESAIAQLRFPKLVVEGCELPLEPIEDDAAGPHPHVSVLLSCIAPFCTLETIASLSRCCTLFNAVVCSDEVWCKIWERHSDCVQASLPDGLTWKEHFKDCFLKSQQFSRCPPSVVFRLGCWRVMATHEKQTFVWKDDESVLIEIVWMSNGWFRMRLGGTDSVVWAEGTTTRQKLHDKTFISEATQEARRAAVPLLTSTRPAVCKVDFMVTLLLATDTALVVKLPTGLDLVFPRDPALPATYNHTPLEEL